MTTCAVLSCKEFYALLISWLCHDTQNACLGAAEQPGCSHPARPWVGEDPHAPIQVAWQRLPGQLRRVGGSEHLFCRLYGSASPQDTFWLDRYVGECFGPRPAPTWPTGQLRVNFHAPHEQSQSSHTMSRPGTLCSDSGLMWNHITAARTRTGDASPTWGVRAGPCGSASHTGCPRRSSGHRQTAGPGHQEGRSWWRTPRGG